MTESYNLVGLDLESPLINAAGSINGTDPERILREVETLADTGIGAITVGSFTIPPQEGNAAKYGEPTYYYDSNYRETYNSMGLPNVGLEAALALAPEIIARASGKPIIFSGSPTLSPEHGSSVEQATRLAYDLLDTGVSLVEINVSCPNVVTEGGGRKPIMGYDLETMEELVDTLADEVGKEQGLGIKLPPYRTDEELAIADSLSRLFDRITVAQFLVTSNTIPNQVPVNERGEHILSVPEGKGGMSGPGTFLVGRDQLLLWKGLMHNRFNANIVSTLGLDSGAELATRLKLGAVAAGGVSFLWNSPNWKKATTQILADFVDCQS